MDKKSFFKRLVHYFFKWKKELIIFLVTTIIALLANFFSPMLSAKVLTAITNVNINDIILFSVLIFGVSCISNLNYKFNSLSGQKIQDNVTLDIKKEVTTELFRLETKNFDEKGTGFFTERINSEPRNIAKIFSMVRYDFGGFITSAGALIYILFIQWQYIFLIITFSVLEVMFSKKRKEIWERHRKERNALEENRVSNFSEIIRGIRDIKVLNIKHTMIEKTAEELEYITKRDLDHSIESNRLTVFRITMDDLYNLLFIILGVFFLLQGSLSGANFLVLYMYRNRAMGCISGFTSIYESVKEFNFSVNRLYEVVDGTYPKEQYGNIILEHAKGDVVFDKVHFAYKENHPVLKGISFSVKEKQMVGIVGKSGSGKTTILHLLAKLYQVNDGKILLDGIPLNDLTEDSIRENISIITQNPYIFNVTIRENLLLVNPELTEKEMIEKCKMCGLDDFVQTLEKKYDTKIGENGIILSGGQRQRLAIARAMVKNSKILVFDEATSALDNETQEHIQSSIHSISKDYTIIIVAHRLSTVIDCDNILVLDDGKIVGEGTHKELMKNNKVYQNLYHKEMQANK